MHINCIFCILLANGFHSFLPTNPHKSLFSAKKHKFFQISKGIIFFIAELTNEWMKNFVRIIYRTHLKR